MADQTDVREYHGVSFLNPNNLPSGAQVTYWAFDDNGPAECPVTLETVATHIELTHEDAIRLGQALIDAARRD